MLRSYVLNEKVALSALDTRLELSMLVNASKESIGYVLTLPYQEDIDFDVSKKEDIVWP